MVSGFPQIAQIDALISQMISWVLLVVLMVGRIGVNGEN